MSIAPLILTGSTLTAWNVAQVSRSHRQIIIAEDAIHRMEAARSVVNDYITENRSAYGLNTGLGARMGHRLNNDQLSYFSILTIRGRSNGVGKTLAQEIVRATMLIRLNGLLAGGSGAAPGVAVLLTKCLNQGLHPRIPSIGSVGMGDLCLMAHLGLALIGEGEMEFRGEQLPAIEAFARCNLKPLKLEPKDGLAICSASAVSTAHAALVFYDAHEILKMAQIAAALSMEGFRANLSPLDPRAIAARPLPGQQQVANELLELLAGSELRAMVVARRLQDPLSFRCVAQVHSSLLAALNFLSSFLEGDLNGATDNPLVLGQEKEIFSTGNFHTGGMALALGTLAQALSHLAGSSVSRCARLLTNRFSDLPANLTHYGGSRSGFAPLLKTADALLAEIRHFALPVTMEQRWGADGVEDESSYTSFAGRNVHDILERLRLLLAIELLIACQAVEVAEVKCLGNATGQAYKLIRERIIPLDEDRPFGIDVEKVEQELLSSGLLLDSVGKVIKELNA